MVALRATNRMKADIPLLPEEGCHEVTGWWERPFTPSRTTPAGFARHPSLLKEGRVRMARRNAFLGTYSEPKWISSDLLMLL